MLQHISNSVYAFQKYNDRLMSKTFDRLWLFFGITPNMLTITRFIGTAALWVLFLTTDPNIFWDTGILVLFIITALTDLWDGSLARNTNQITDLGTTLDPLADKLLIGSILVFLAFTLNHWTIYMIIFLEAMMIILNIVFYIFLKGKAQGANAYGKFKMALEVFFVIFLLIGVYQKNPTVLSIGFFIGGVAIFFAIVSMLKGVQEGASAI